MTTHHHPFYSSGKWRKTRAAYIQSVFGECERCDQPGVQLHHKIHLNQENINDADITLNHYNLEYLCAECHRKHHQIKPGYNNGLKFTENGDLIKI